MGFNVGPWELIVLAIVGLIVLGPDRLPGLAKDAAQLIRTLREIATGARTQLRDELGPEFADMDLSNLNPRTAITRAVLGEDVDLSMLNPRTALQKTLFGTDEAATGAVSLEKAEPVRRALPAPRPLGRGEHAPFDTDAT